MELNDKFEKAPHFCQDGHEPIRHWDSENELCPLCRSVGLAEDLAAMLSSYMHMEPTDEMRKAAEKLIGRTFPD